MNCKYDKATCSNLKGSFKCSCPLGSSFNATLRDCQGKCIGLHNDCKQAKIFCNLLTGQNKFFKSCLLNIYMKHLLLI